MKATPVPKKGAKPAKGAAKAAKPASQPKSAPHAAPAAAPPPLLSPAEQEAQRRQRAEERERLRAEMEQAILEEEARIRTAEMAARKAEVAQRKLEARLLEAAFEGEIEPIRAQVAAWQAECASTLIGAKLGVADASGHTLLSEAAVAGHADICELLLRAGAPANCRNRQGRTPLWRAAFQRRVETVRLLLEHGADPRVASSDGETPAMVALDPALKAELGAWDVARTDELLARAEGAAQWSPPPPDPCDAHVPSGQAGHSAQIIIQRLPDVLDELTLRGERYALIVDLGGKALIYLQYRDCNCLNSCRPADVAPEAVRRALVGALRYGKPLVLDLTLMGDVSLPMLDAFFEAVRPGGGLRDAVLDRRILRPEAYEPLLTPDELGAHSDLRPSQWQEATTARFCLCVVTKNPILLPEITERFFVVKCA